MDSSEVALPPRLVLYDGVCGFCDRTVQHLIALDKAGRLHFAPLQGPTGTAILSRHPEVPKGLDSILYVESASGTESVRWWSQAVLHIAAALELTSPLLALAGWLPRWCADLGYRAFAAVRYRLFGRLNQCRVPSAEQRARFLD
ncbi:MAG: DUF393 domain-containing protein [Deltaproteobacteria bacterium]|nr:DUF393 domain-containing protein [Deltaproteobacteria bacterium]